MAIDAGELRVRITAQLKNLSANLSRSSRMIKTWSSRIDARLQANAEQWQMLGRQMRRTGLVLTAVSANAVRQFGNFEGAMRKATAATDITETEFGELSAFVQKEATAINVAAVTAADGIRELGFAGLSAKEQMQAFPPLLRLSKAGMADMGETAERVLGIMGAFEIQFEKTSEVTDTLAKLWGSSRQSLSQLSEAMSFTAATAKNMGLSLEELGALTAVLSEAGIKGSRAGTTLRRSLLNLQAPTSAMSQTLRDLNVQIADNEGNLRNGVDVLDDFFEAVSKVSEAQRAQAFRTVFGARAVEGMTVAFNKGIGSIRGYADSLENARGSVDLMVERQMKAFNEQIGVSVRLLSTLSRTIGRMLVPEIGEMNKNLQDSIVLLNEWAEENENIAKAIAVTTTTLGVMLVGMGTALGVMANLALTARLLGVSMAVLSAKMALVTGGLTLLAFGIGAVVSENLKLKRQTRETEKAIKDSKTTIDEYNEKWAKLAVTLNKVAEGQALVTKKITIETAIRKATEELTSLSEGYKKLTKNIFVAAFANTVFDRRMEMTRGRMETLKQVLIGLKAALSDVTDEGQMTFKKIEDAAEQSANNTKNSLGFLKDAFAETATSMASSMEDGFADVLQGTKKFTEGMNSFLNELNDMILRFFIQQTQKNFFLPLLERLSPSVFGGITGAAFPTGGAVEGARTGGKVHAGRIQPVYAARGFVPRGSDTVPAMLAEGETIVPKNVSNFLQKAFGGAGLGGGSSTNVIFNVSAIDSRGVADFFEQNKSAIAKSIQSANRDNSAFRRSGG